MININTIDITSLILGIGTTSLFWIIVSLIFRRKKTTLPELKHLVEDTHEHLQAAAENQIKLYQVFNEIEEMKK